MTVAILVVVVLPTLLAAAAVLDLILYRIPNVIPASMIALFFAFTLLLVALGNPMSLSDTGFHLLAGALGLVLGMALFAAGWVGGGDAKLFAAALLWLGWDALYDYAMLVALLGGGLTLALIALRRLPMPMFLMKQSWFARLADHTAGIPYGIALALAALFVLPDTDVFQIASQT